MVSVQLYLRHLSVTITDRADAYTESLSTFIQMVHSVMHFPCIMCSFGVTMEAEAGMTIHS